jgi:3-hydroxymyristoyl/3-hydroxydecanoyl-(acyl carrier protein) dehydratase
MNVPTTIMHSTIELERNHPAYAGHFPTFPVLPGAVLLDEALQIIRRERRIDLTQWRVACKFHGAVRPGDVAALEHDLSRSGLIRFTIRVGERMVAGGNLTIGAPADGHS